MREKVLIAALILVLVAGAAYCQSSKTGTAGAQELRIPVGPRGTSMAGAVVADATGSDALFWNPAGAAKTTGTNAFLAYKGYLADMTVSYFGVLSQFNYGTVGVSAKILSLGDIKVTTENDWNGTGEVYSINVPVLGLTYAYNLTDRVSFGITGMYLNEEIMQTKATGIAFDAGFQYVPGWRTIKLGMVMKNYGPRMEFSGPGLDVSSHVPGDDPEAANRTLSLTSAGYEMPSSFEMGGSYEFATGTNAKTIVGVAFQSNNFSADEYRIGAEYNLGGRLYVRGGYVFCDQEGYLYGPALGFGANFNLGTVKASIDYSHTFVNKYFDDIPEVTMSFGL